MPELHFDVPDQGTLVCTPAAVAIVGYTGRDQAAVQAHIAELAAQGIAPPPRVPMVYAVTPDRLVQEAIIDVTGENTTGEAEFMVVVHDGQLYIGVGSDHTDRTLEQLDIPAAKQVCPKVIGRTLWPLATVEAHWDTLLLRAWVGEERRPYQAGSVAALLPPRAIYAIVAARARAPLTTAVISCGTLPLLEGHFRPAALFAAELYDPVCDRRLTCEYRVRVIDNFAGTDG